MTYRHSRRRQRPRTRLGIAAERGLGIIARLRPAVVRGMLWLPGFLALMGLLMRLSVRDRIEPISYVHYGTPWPVIAVLAFVASVIFGFRRGRGRLIWTCGFAGLGLAAGLMWSLSSFERGNPTVPVSAESPVLRVVVWNAEGKLLSAELLRALRDVEPDLALVVESGYRTGPPFKTFFAKTHHTWSPGGHMMVLSRDEMTPDPDSWKGRGWWNYDHLNRFLGFSTRFEGRPLRVLGVDVYSRAKNKRSVAAEHAARMGRQDEIPTIVLGDFNTPADSVWFESMREVFFHAFERAGEGYSATWPEPVPVLQIDHVWLERGAFEVVQVQQIDTNLSDHRMLVVDLQFVE